MNAEMDLAGRGRRFLATLLDLTIVFLFGLLLMLVSGVLEDAEDYGSALLFLKIPLLGIVSYLILNAGLLWKRGQTVGKWVMGIRTVAAATGVTASFPILCLRSLFFLAVYVLLSPIGLLVIVDHLMIFGRRRHCLHDRICRTSVVRNPGKA